MFKLVKYKLLPENKILIDFDTIIEFIREFWLLLIFVVKVIERVILIQQS